MPLISLRRAGLAALLAAAAPAAAFQPATAAADALAPAAAEPAAAVDAFHAALRRGDTDAALAMLADEALILEQGGAEHGKAEYAASHLAADSAFEREVKLVTTRRTGDAAGEFAWIATEGRATGSFHGRPVDRATAESMVLRRSGGSWRIVHIHWSSAAGE